MKKGQRVEDRSRLRKGKGTVQDCHNGRAIVKWDSDGTLSTRRTDELIDHGRLKL